MPHALASPVAARSKASEEGALPRGTWVPKIRSGASRETPRGNPPCLLYTSDAADDTPCVDL
eukprot:2158032-Pyramimonas_sp.AAC.1